MRRAATPQKISVMEILDESFSIYLERIEVFFAVFLPLNVANLILMRAVNPLAPQFNPPYESADKLILWLVNYGAHMTAVLCILFLISWVIMNIGNSLIIKFVSDFLRGRKAYVKNGFTSTLHLLTRVSALSLITGALMALGFILLVFPGLMMAVIFSLSVPAMTLENLGVFGSLKRSKELTDGRWMKTFTLLFALFAIFIIAVSLTEVLTLTFHRLPHQMWIKEAFRAIILSLIEPLYPISLTLFYYRVRERGRGIPPPQLPPEAWVCRYCGQILPQDAIYCPNCGRKVKFPPNRGLDA